MLIAKKKSINVLNDVYNAGHVYTELTIRIKKSISVVPTGFRLTFTQILVRLQKVLFLFYSVRSLISKTNLRHLLRLLNCLCPVFYSKVFFHHVHPSFFGFCSPGFPFHCRSECFLLIIELFDLLTRPVVSHSSLSYPASRWRFIANTGPCTNLISISL